MDLDIDSNNNEGFAFTEGSDKEDWIENSATVARVVYPEDVIGTPRPGKIVLSNNRTDSASLGQLVNGGGEGLTAVSAGLQFVPVLLELKEPFDPATAMVTFTYDASEPNISDHGISETGTEAPYVYSINTGGMRLWKKKATERTSGEAVPDGDFISADTEINWSDIATDISTPRIANLYLEYVDKSTPEAAGLKPITVTVTGNGATTEDQVNVNLLPVELKFVKRLTEQHPVWLNWAFLEEKEVIQHDADTHLRIKLPQVFNNLDQLVATPELSKIKIKTSGTGTEGVEFSLTSQNSDVTFKRNDQSQPYMEVFVTLTREELKNQGLLPENEIDDVPEKAWYDTGTTGGTNSNLSDGLAFDAQYPAEVRGRCTVEGTLNSEPPNSPLHKSFLIAGGVEIVSATFGGVESDPRQIANPADVLYFSGHGDHKTAQLNAGNKEWFHPSEQKWNNEVDRKRIFFC